MEFVSRREWGAQPARSSTALNPARVTMLVLHHTVSMYAGPQSVRNIQSFHMNTNGWADLGYNWLVSPAGTVYEGRGWGTQGAHARGQNANSIGVAYIGDGRLPVSDAAKFAILRLAAEADRRFGRELRRVGHRDVGATACPGDVLYGWWASGPSLPPAPEPEPKPEPAPAPSPAPVPVPPAAKPEPPVDRGPWQHPRPDRKRPAFMDGWKARLLGFK